MLKIKNRLVGKIKSKNTLKGKLNNAIVYVEPELENLEVIPTKEQQTFNHKNSYGYDKVTVVSIPDEYIIPDGTLEVTENITYDVTPYSKVNARVYPTPNLQDKSITITENGTQNITYDDGYDGLKNVEVTTNIESSGGGSVGHPYIVYEYGSDTTNTTTHNLQLAELIPKFKGIWDRIIVYGFVRSDYTISDCVNILCEKEVTDGGTKQTLFVGYTDIATNIVLTQTTNNRMSLRAMFLSNCGKPIVIDDIENVKQGDVAITTDDCLNIYLETMIYNSVVTGVNFNEWGGNERTWWFVSAYARNDRVIKHSGGDTYGAIAHLRIPTRTK